MKKNFLGIICLLYTIIIFYMSITGLIANYLAPFMQKYLIIAILPLLIIGIVLIRDKHYHFKVTDLVLLLPIICIFITNDAHLSNSLVINKNNNVIREKVDVNNKQSGEINIAPVSEITSIDFDVIDASYEELSAYITYNKNAQEFIGKTIRVKGFAVKQADYLPKGYISIGKYVISCCAADATYSGFIAKTDLSKVEDGKWYQIEGILQSGIDADGYNMMYIETVNIKQIDEKSEKQYAYPCYYYDNGYCSELSKYNLKY